MISLSAEDKQLLLHLARQALVHYFATGQVLLYETTSPALLERRATFVTLRRRDTGELRGCRGESVAKRPLFESIIQMSIASATNDPRFTAVTLDEVPWLRIEINALTPLYAIRPSDIEIGKHGLMIMQSGHAGLLLPEVPVRHKWGRKAFLKGICHKAGLPEDAWKSPKTQLFAFEAEVWEEEEV